MWRFLTGGGGGPPKRPKLDGEKDKAAAAGQNRDEGKQEGQSRANVSQQQLAYSSSTLESVSAQLGSRQRDQELLASYPEVQAAASRPSQVVVSSLGNYEQRVGTKHDEHRGAGQFNTHANAHYLWQLQGQNRDEGKQEGQSRANVSQQQLAYSSSTLESVSAQLGSRQRDQELLASYPEVQAAASRPSQVVVSSLGNYEQRVGTKHDEHRGAGQFNTHANAHYLWQLQGQNRDEGMQEGQSRANVSQQQLAYSSSTLESVSAQLGRQRDQELLASYPEVQAAASRPSQVVVSSLGNYEQRVGTKHDEHRGAGQFNTHANAHYLWQLQGQNRDEGMQEGQSRANVSQQQLAYSSSTLESVSAQLGRQRDQGLLASYPEVQAAASRPSQVVVSSLGNYEQRVGTKHDEHRGAGQFNTHANAHYLRQLQGQNRDEGKQEGQSRANVSQQQLAYSSSTLESVSAQLGRQRDQELLASYPEVQAAASRPSQVVVSSLGNYEQRVGTKHDEHRGAGQFNAHYLRQLQVPPSGLQAVKEAASSLQMKPVDGHLQHRKYIKVAKLSDALRDKILNQSIPPEDFADLGVADLNQILQANDERPPRNATKAVLQKQVIKLLRSSIREPQFKDYRLCLLCNLEHAQMRHQICFHAFACRSCWDKKQGQLIMCPICFQNMKVEDVDEIFYKRVLS